MELKKIRILLLWSLWIVFLPVFFALFMHKHAMVLYWISIVLAAIWVVLSHVFWRCPHCREPLGRVDEKKKYCPQCGRPLNLDGE